MFDPEGNPIPCYDSAKVLDMLVDAGMSEDQAMDYVESETEHPRSCGYTPEIKQEFTPDAEGCATRRHVALMRYGSVCSGIEAATQAWHGMGWEPAFFSEIDAFPSAVLQHHYPEVPLHGDFTTIKDDEYGAIDLLVGGTPCQSFSVAGLRGGMDDDRGNLSLEFLRLAQRKTPKWLVWENVPGVLSSNGGRDFGSFLGALAEIGYGFAYRILTLSTSEWPKDAASVCSLSDTLETGDVPPRFFLSGESLCGNPPPSREKGEKLTPLLRSALEATERVEADGNALCQRQREVGLQPVG